MTSRAVPSGVDPIGARDDHPLEIRVDDRPVTGVVGQTLAGVLLAAGENAWRTTSRGGRPRGVFCGIGVCFDCLVVVNGARDVRSCQRRAVDGDVVTTQHDPLPVIDLHHGEAALD